MFALTLPMIRKNKTFTVMKKIMLLALSMYMMASQAQVATLQHANSIHQMRIYNDTIFASSDAGISYYALSEPKGWQRCLDRDGVVCDFVKWGDNIVWADNWLTHFYQNPQRPGDFYKVERAASPDTGFWAYLCYNFKHWTKVLWMPYNLSLAYNPQNAQELLGFGLDDRVNCICPVMRHFSQGVGPWSEVNFMFDEDRDATIFTDMAYSPAGNGVVVASLTNGMALSTDGGQNWKYTSPKISGINFAHVAFDSDQPDVVYTCGRSYSPGDGSPEKGEMVMRSTDGGRSWEVIYIMDNETFVHGWDFGMVCYKGRLYCWKNDTIYIFTSPDSMTALTNSIEKVAAEPAMEERMFDLQGRAVTIPQRGGIYVRNGQKVVVR